MTGFRLWQIAGWTMLHYFWIGALLGAAAMVLRRLLQPTSPTVRYTAALGCFFLLCASPIGIAAWATLHVPSQTLPNVALDVAPPSQEFPAVAPENVQSAIAADAPMMHGGGLPPVAEANVHSEPLPQPVAPQEETTWLAAFDPIAARLPWLWLIGSPLTFLLTTAGLLGAERLRRSSRPPADDRTAELCRRLAEAMRISRRVGVAVCDRIAAPILLGVVRPMILLPAAAAGWTPEQLEMVLLHELAHVRRFDNLVNLAQRFLESVLFFHPMVWLVSAWVRREREHCCDALVVSRTGRPHDYAALLVALAETFSTSLSRSRVVSSMAERPLVVRVRQILNKEGSSMRVSSRAISLIFAVTIILAVLCGWYYSCISYAKDDLPKAEDTSRLTLEEILQLLRTNDARFDNLDLKYLKIEKHDIRPSRFNEQRWGEDISQKPKDYWDTRTVKWVRSCSLVVRGKNMILASQFEPELSEKDKYVAPGAFFKEGIIEGIRHQIDNMQLPDDSPAKQSPNYEKQYRVTREPPTWGREMQMAIEFPFGVGFGKRIKSINSVTVRNGKRIIAGDIQIWAEDVSRFEIELDENGLVRKAAILSDVKGHRTQFEVTSSGAIRHGGLLLAKSGTFKRSWQPSPEQMNRGAAPKLQHDFRLEFKSVTQNLSDEQYAKLAEFKIEPLMKIDDEVNGIHGTGAKREDGSVYVKEWGKNTDDSTKKSEVKSEPTAPKANSQSGNSVRETPLESSRNMPTQSKVGKPADAVEGVVVDEAGKPIAGTRVAATAAHDGSQGFPHTHLLGETTSDAEGVFHLQLKNLTPDLLTDQFLRFNIFVIAPGYGVRADYSLGLTGPRRKVTIRLVKEQSPIGGQLLNDKGKPAAGVRVHLRSFQRDFEGGILYPNVDTQAWPESVMTDAQGRFAFRNVGASRDVVSPARMEVEVEIPGDKPKTTYITAADDPKIRVEVLPVVKGTVICQETGKPLANATIFVTDGRQGLIGSVQGVTACVFGTKTDVEGRFSVRHCHLQWTTIHVTPPTGDPHLFLYQHVNVDRGRALLVTNLAVPRGVVLRGTVVEAGSGTPIQGVWVQPENTEKKTSKPSEITLAGRQDTTDEHGCFEIVVVPGAGRLTVTPTVGPAAKHVQHARGEIAWSKIENGIPVMKHSDGDLPVKIVSQQGTEFKEIVIELRKSEAMRDAAGSPNVILKAK